MNLTELKQKTVSELLAIANEMGLEGVARQRRQDVIFSILKAHAKNGEAIFGDGVLEILQDGFGFLRSADSSYLAGPDDIYVSPSQIRRFALRTGDMLTGKIRPPKDSERYFALLKVQELNYESPDAAKQKILFENLTAEFPRRQIESRTRQTAVPRTSRHASSTWWHRSAKASAAWWFPRPRPAKPSCCRISQPAFAPITPTAR